MEKKQADDVELQLQGLLGCKVITKLVNRKSDSAEELLQGVLTEHSVVYPSVTKTN